MKMGRFVSAAIACWLLHSFALAATPTWTQSLSGAPDGASYGDVDGDGQFEIAVIVRGDPGQVVLLSHAGEILWTHTATSSIVGFPTFGDYDGNGTDEVAYCESDTDSPCRVLNADGTVRYSFGAYYYPGMSGSGPTAADITGDGADDLLVLSWGGDVVLIDGPSGFEIWSYDTWETNGELLFGPSVVADVDGDGDLDVVFGGWLEGTLFVLDAATGAEVWPPKGLWSTWGNYFYGNGALVDDLDGDGSREIVVALDGDPPSVAAFSSTGETLWRTTLPVASWFAWLTPVAADLDADGRREVLAQSGDGVLYVVDADGALIGSPSLGGDSWIAPGFIDLDFDLLPEIVAATENSLLLLDGENFAELDRHDDTSGGMYPQILVGDLGRDGEVNIVAGSWNAESIYHYSFSAANVSAWSALGGGATHRGRLELVCQGVCASPDASVNGSATLGEGVIVGPDATISAGATVGDGTIIGEQTWVAWFADVGDDVVIQPEVVVLSGANIGDGSTIGQQSWIGWNADIGMDVMIGEEVVIRINTRIGSGTVIGRGTTIGPFTIIGANVTIGEDCRIGRNVRVGDGVSIPDGTVVPNNAVVP
ncbi:MAG: FG-GAP-like repeat-containing protein [Polyangiales bacterium]